MNQTRGRIRCWFAGAVATFAIMGVGTALAEVSNEDVANTVSKAANYIYFASFEQDSVTTAFGEDELKILSAHLEPLDVMIREALGVQHSVGGAMLMAHFGLKDNMDYLRSHILTPGRTYGWEGSYESDEKRFYSDHQYVYHSVYVKAFEALSGAPLHEAITLSSRETESLLRLATNQSSESYYWAIWLGRKFRIL